VTKETEALVYSIKVLNNVMKNTANGGKFLGRMRRIRGLIAEQEGQIDRLVDECIVVDEMIFVTCLSVLRSMMMGVAYPFVVMGGWVKRLWLKLAWRIELWKSFLKSSS